MSTITIQEGMLPRPQALHIDAAVIERILQEAGVHTPIARIGEPYPWVMQSQRIWLRDGRCLLLKVGVNDQWTDSSSILDKVRTTDLLQEIGFQQPETLHYSAGTEYGFRFILTAEHKGKKLAELYNSASPEERKRMCKTLGATYSRIHQRTNEWAGIWADGDLSKQKYPIHPADFYLKAELNDGSGQYLVEKSLVATTSLERIIRLWNDNLEYLKTRPSALVHVSAFPWTIYLFQRQGEYVVEGFKSLGDFMWWDPMYDVAQLLYPPFMDIEEGERTAFIEGYGQPIETHAVNLYTILNRLCAMSGCFLAPIDKIKAEAWISQESANLVSKLDQLESRQ